MSNGCMKWDLMTPLLRNIEIMFGNRSTDENGYKLADWPRVICGRPDKCQLLKTSCDKIIFFPHHPAHWINLLTWTELNSIFMAKVLSGCQFSVLRSTGTQRKSPTNVTKRIRTNSVRPQNSAQKGSKRLWLVWIVVQVFGSFEKQPEYRSCWQPVIKNFGDMKMRRHSVIFSWAEKTKRNIAGTKHSHHSTWQQVIWTVIYIIAFYPSPHDPWNASWSILLCAIQRTASGDDQKRVAKKLLDLLWEVNSAIYLVWGYLRVKTPLRSVLLDPLSFSHEHS